jgi:hypothetical protein
MTNALLRQINQLRKRNFQGIRNFKQSIKCWVDFPVFKFFNRLSVFVTRSSQVGLAPTFLLTEFNNSQTNALF